MNGIVYARCSLLLNVKAPLHKTPRMVRVDSVIPRAGRHEERGVGVFPRVCDSVAGSTWGYIVVRGVRLKEFPVLREGK